MNIEVPDDWVETIQCIMKRSDEAGYDGAQAGVIFNIGHEMFSLLEYRSVTGHTILSASDYSEIDSGGA